MKILKTEKMKGRPIILSNEKFEDTGNGLKTDKMKGSPLIKSKKLSLTIVLNLSEIDIYFSNFLNFIALVTSINPSLPRPSYIDPKGSYRIK